MKSKLSTLEEKLNIRFKNRQLLENSFIHRSYLNENKNLKLTSYEKLEFLGDSVLSLITSAYLYNRYPFFQEGDYTEIKSSIVRTGSLAEAAEQLNLGKYLYLSKGEEIGNGRKNKNILADVFEALIGTIFLDQGFTKAYKFVDKYLFTGRLDKVINEKLYLSAKSKLQELIQAQYKVIPQYRVLAERGPEHKRTFRVGIFFKEKKLAEAEGPSKKQAEEEAARKALQKL